jgi:hypothetical protein
LDSRGANRKSLKRRLPNEASRRFRRSRRSKNGGTKRVEKQGKKKREQQGPRLILHEAKVVAAVEESLADEGKVVRDEAMQLVDEDEAEAAVAKRWQMRGNTLIMRECTYCINAGYMGRRLQKGKATQT